MKAIESKVRMGFIIPTMNRPDELNRLLKSIYSQNTLPEYLIIVDGSDTSIESTISIDERVPLLYVREHPPSLTKQRNRGIRAIPEYLTHIGFLDDDLVMIENCLSTMVGFIEANYENLGGASFNIQDKAPGPLRFLSVLAGHSSIRPGNVAISGYASSNVGVKENRFTQWLCGGATVWRAEVLKEFKFDEWFKGYALWEDVDFSYRVSKKWRLAVVADAKVLHLHIGDMNKKKAAIIGDLEVVDRFYFVKKHFEHMSFAAAIWATFGIIVRNLLNGLKNRETNYLYRAISNFKALTRCASGRIERSEPR